VPACLRNPPTSPSCSSAWCPHPQAERAQEEGRAAELTAQAQREIAGAYAEAGVRHEAEEARLARWVVGWVGHTRGWG